MLKCLLLPSMCMTQMQGAQTKQCNVKSDLLSQETKSMKITQT